MNLSDFPPFDESVLGRALTPGPIYRRGQPEAVSRADLVQSNMSMEWVPETPAGIPDIQAIRRRAEAMRTAYIRGKVEAVFAALENWYARLRQREFEEYLAGSQNLAELESRMRRYTVKRSAFGMMNANFD
jgi:hypothetical protein